MILLEFWHLGKLLWHLSTRDNERNLCHDLLLIKNTDSDLKARVLHCTMQMIYLYASDLPSKNFCTLPK